MNDSVVSNNTAASTGGGIRVFLSSNLTLIGSVVSNNTANLVAGGIHASESSVQLTSTTISENSANDSGGIFLIGDSGQLVTTDSTISGNTANFNGGGISFLNGADGTITDSTISGNTTTSGAGGIFSNSSFLTSTVTLTNVTISENRAQTSGGGVFSSGVVNTIVGNTIIAGNTADTSPDVSGTFTSNGNNLIGDGTGSTGFSAVTNDQVGTTGSPIVPLLGPLMNNGGPTETMALLSGSPAIDAGKNSLNTNTYDQRGNPFLRVVGGVIDIGAFEVQAVICYSGKSKVLTKTSLTSVVKRINAEDVIAGTHLVFNTVDKTFIPVELNIVTGTINRFMLIKRNALGKNKPSRDFYVTSGHRIIINGVETKAGNIPQAVRIKVEPQKVYSICTKQKCPIIVNNLCVMTWGYEEFMTYAKKRGVSWVNNNKYIKQNNMINAKKREIRWVNKSSKQNKKSDTIHKTKLKA